jgi:hypothetical protein
MVLLDPLHLSEVCPNTLTTPASRVRVRSPTWMQDSGCRCHTPPVDNTMSGTDDPTQGTSRGAMPLPGAQATPPPLTTSYVRRPDVSMS